ncbi:MAG: carbonic anhydrase [Archangium sp.]|nr:carbonic anhydrase [Archangium sp.]
MAHVKVAAIAVAGLLTSAALLLSGTRTQFLVGGALVSAGVRLQDHLEPYDFVHEDATESPEQVWAEFQKQNELSATVRERFPRTAEHPMVALLVCMDSRIDTSELAGDTRGYYYVVRTAGSVLGPEEQEMLELAVANGVKLIVLTRHTDCAAEKAAGDPAMQAQYPTLTRGVLERDQRVAEFLARPLVAERISSGALLVKQVVIETGSEHLLAGFPTR